MNKLYLTFVFTPADGSRVRTFQVTLATQEDPRYPYTLTIDWDDGRRPDHQKWPGPPLFGLELAGRFIAQRILDHVELAGGGTVEPEVVRPRPYAPVGHEEPAEE